MSSERKIFLLRSQKAVFPDFCICCGADSPEEWLKFGQGHDRISLKSLLVEDNVGKVAVDVPVCGGCADRLHRTTAMRKVVVFALSVLGVGAVLWTFFEYYGAFKKVVVALSFILPFLPMILVNHFLPPPIAVDYKFDGTYFKFADIDYAEAFRLLNEDDGI